MRDILPLYDAMFRLFIAGISVQKVSIQVIAHILNIPKGTMMKLMKTIPSNAQLPFNAKIVQGGHRSLEWFVDQPTKLFVNNQMPVVEEICNEKIWSEYGLMLRKDRHFIIAETDKAISNANEIEGSMKKIQAVIGKGDPAKYRCFWFVKDAVNGDFYHTVHDALHKATPGKKAAGEKETSRGNATPGVGKSSIINQIEVPKYYASIPPAPMVAPTKPSKSWILQFVGEIQDLVINNELLVKTIKGLESKIEAEYPALIAQKEREKAEAEREWQKCKERIKILEGLNKDQERDIQNLKRHPKFAGYVKVAQNKK
jgi:hypothetical protein